MTDLERCALLGDKQAQEECTEKGLLLPCPFCGGNAMVEYDAIAPFEYSVCCGDCGVQRGLSEDEKVAKREWNTRSTPQIVRELRENLERVTAERDEARRDCAVAEGNHSECLVQLAKARVQLKSAVTDMEALMWHSGDGCNICKHCVEVHRNPYVRLDCDLGSGCDCKPEWRGLDGDHP